MRQKKPQTSKKPTHKKKKKKASYLDHFRVCLRLTCQEVLGFLESPPLVFVDHWKERDVSVSSCT